MDLQLARKYARALMDLHGLKNWDLGFEYTITTLGACYFDKKLICLSEPFTLQFDAAFVVDTVLHEIAHVFAGDKAGHKSAEWLNHAATLGADTEVPSNRYKLPGRYQAICPRCKLLHHQYRIEKGSHYCVCLSSQSVRNRLNFVDITQVEDPARLGYDPNPVKLCYPRAKRRTRRG